MTAFIIWALCGVLFLALGIYCFFTEKQVGFWANAKVAPVSDIKAFNRAVGRLWCGFAAVFVLLGLPLLTNSTVLLLLVSVPGTVLECLVLMILFTRIEDRYLNKK